MVEGTMRMNKTIGSRLRNFLVMSVLAFEQADKNFLYVPYFAFKILRYKIRFGGSIRHYVLYRYWQYEKLDSSTHFSNEDNIAFVEAINEQGKINVLRDKTILLNRMGDRLGRDFMDLSKTTKDAFWTFVSHQVKLVVKPPSLARGEGIRTVSPPKTRETSDALWQRLIEEGCTLVESFIEQHPEMNRFHAGSVAIFKIHTLNTGHDVRIDLPPLFQFGRGKSDISHGGYTLPVFLDTGLIVWPERMPKAMRDAMPYEYLVGRALPFFREALALARELATIVPEMTFASWDIAITNTGPVVIEGNGAPLSFLYVQSYFYQTTGQGAKPFYRNLLNYAKKRPHVTKGDLQAIETFLFYESEATAVPPDILMILGSARCGYRVEEALRIGAKNDRVRYLVSGGNPSRETLEPNDSALRSESEYMLERLLLAGVPKERIVVETQARSTKENIERCLPLLDEMTIASKEQAPVTVGIVTAGFHMRRSYELLQTFPDASRYAWVLFPAYGPHTQKGAWADDPEGFSVVMSELEKFEGERLKRNGLIGYSQAVEADE